MILPSCWIFWNFCLRWWRTIWSQGLCQSMGVHQKVRWTSREQIQICGTLSNSPVWHTCAKHLSKGEWVREFLQCKYNISCCSSFTYYHPCSNRTKVKMRSRLIPFFISAKISSNQGICWKDCFMLVGRRRGAFWIQTRASVDWFHVGKWDSFVVVSIEYLRNKKQGFLPSILFSYKQGMGLIMQMWGHGNCLSRHFGGPRKFKKVRWVPYDELVEICDVDLGKLHVFNTEGVGYTYTDNRKTSFLIRFAAKGSQIIRWA